MLDFGFYNMDCMEGMKEFPDKYFDLAVVDPPYFSGPERRGFYGRKISPIGVQRIYEKAERWEIPGPQYFKELERVSKHQIVFGCNYFRWYFRPGRIVWDKCNGKSSFSDCEIASCSLHEVPGNRNSGRVPGSQREATCCRRSDKETPMQ